LAGGGVDTREVLVIAVAGLEGPVLRCVGSVVSAADTVVDVLAEFGGVGAGGITCLNAERVSAHEIVPFDNLLEAVLVAAVAREGVRIQKASKRVSTQVGTVGIEFTTEVTFLDVDQALMEKANDLDVIGRPHELDACQGTLGNQASSTARLRAPGDFLALSVGDGGVRIDGSPEAEIIEAVHKGRLAKRFRAFGCGVADVVTSLTTAEQVVRIGLVRYTARVGKVFGGERSGRSGRERRGCGRWSWRSWSDLSEDAGRQNGDGQRG